MYQLSTGEYLRNEILKNTEIGKKFAVINSGSLASTRLSLI